MDLLSVYSLEAADVLRLRDGLIHRLHQLLKVHFRSLVRLRCRVIGLWHSLRPALRALCSLLLTLLGPLLNSTRALGIKTLGRAEAILRDAICSGLCHWSTRHFVTARWIGEVYRVILAVDITVQAADMERRKTVWLVKAHQPRAIDSMAISKRIGSGSSVIESASKT